MGLHSRQTCCADCLKGAKASPAPDLRLPAKHVEKPKCTYVLPQGRRVVMRQGAQLRCRIGALFEPPRPVLTFVLLGRGTDGHRRRLDRSWAPCLTVETAANIACSVSMQAIAHSNEAQEKAPHLHATHNTNKRGFRLGCHIASTPARIKQSLSATPISMCFCSW